MRAASDIFVFTHPASLAADEPPAKEVVVFFAGAPTRPWEVEDAVQAATLRDAAPPARVILLASDTHAEQLEEFAADPGLRETLRLGTRHAEPADVVSLTFSRRGELRSLEDGHESCASEEHRRRLVRAGALQIFMDRDGMLVASPSFHYVNPSQRHTDHFLRAGNVLRHSAEIAFLAFGLLPWWPDGVRRVYTDTAAINALAYAAVDLVRAFEPDLRTPTIDSFSSYRGLEQKYPFDGRDAMCLISASTSGAMQRKLVRDHMLPAERIATIFYWGDAKLDEQQVLCDITARGNDDTDYRFDKMKSYDHASCQLCREGSTAILISGDEFFPGRPDVSEIVLNVTHEPDWLPAFLERTLEAEVLRCHVARTGDEPAREIYVDLAAALSTPSHPLAEAARRRILSAVPARLGRILHLGDPDSRALAQMVVEVTGTSEDLLLTLEQAEEDPALLTAPDATVLVVAGAAATGRSLVAASRLLRFVRREIGHISYLVGVGRPTDERSWRDLCSNVRFGDEPNEYPLARVLVGYLPQPEQTAWHAELSLLNALEQGGAEGAALETIEARRKLIEPGRGLVDDLFLTPCTGEQRLRLQPGFVFWRSIHFPEGFRETPEAGATQAEVYATIAAILHARRDPRASGTRLVPGEYSRTVLSPANFTRFNDGVIQAALLRSARAVELDYRERPDLSRQMQDICGRIVRRRETREGEAAPEFLLALSARRLRLDAADERQLADALDGESLDGLNAALAAHFGAAVRD